MLDDNGEIHAWMARSRSDELKKLDHYNSIKVSKIIERLTGQFDPKAANPFALVVASYILKFNHSTQDSLRLCDKIMKVEFWRGSIGQEKEEQKEI